MVRTTALGLMGAILVASVPVLAQDGEKPAQRVGESGIVRVEETVPRSKPFVPVAGLVTSDGHVLTFMDPTGQSMPVRVVTSLGRSREITGIANYLSSTHVILLTVDWKGEIPPALSLAEHGPGLSQPVTVTALNIEPTGGSSTFRAQRSDTQLISSLQLVNAETPDGLWGGGPVLDDTGRVVGLVNGFVMHAGIPVEPAVMSSGPASLKSLFGVPVELLAAAQRPLAADLTLDQWRAKQTQIGKGAQLCHDAYEAFLRSEFVESVQSARQSVSVDDRSSAGWAVLATILISIKSYDEALKAVSHATELDPSNLRIVYNKALALWSLGRLDDALSDTSRLVVESPNNKQFLVFHGMLLSQKKKTAEAIGFVERAAELDPKDSAIQELLKKLQSELKAK